MDILTVVLVPAVIALIGNFTGSFLSNRYSHRQSENEKSKLSKAKRVAIFTDLKSTKDTAIHVLYAIKEGRNELTCDSLKWCIDNSVSIEHRKLYQMKYDTLIYNGNLRVTHTTIDKLIPEIETLILDDMVIAAWELNFKNLQSLLKTKKDIALYNSLVDRLNNLMFCTYLDITPDNHRLLNQEIDKAYEMVITRLQCMVEHIKEFMHQQIV